MPVWELSYDEMFMNGPSWAVPQADEQRTGTLNTASPGPILPISLNRLRHMTLHPVVARSRLIVASLLGGVAACAPADRSDLADFDPGPPPPELIAGETMYNGSCAKCHGLEGRGTGEGPPLVDEVYRPAHHADAAFQLAVRQGVAPHHWTFGPMPPMPELTPEQVGRITGYVRWLQQQAGIE